MLFKVLKLFGLDVPAKFEALKAGLEQRIDEATEHVKEVAQQTAVITVLLALAGVTALFALGIGLLALYWWTAENYGAYAGLGIVGGLLLIAAIVLAAAAAHKGKELAGGRTNPSRDENVAAGIAPSESADLGAEIGAPRVETVAPSVAASPLSPAPLRDWTRPTATASADDLAEPLAFLLSKVVDYPSVGNPAVDEVLVNMRVAAQGATSEAIDRAADVVRDGNRTQLALVLSGAALIGWLLGNQSRR